MGDIGLGVDGVEFTVKSSTGTSTLRHGDQSATAKFGINVETPTKALQVKGNISASGALMGVTHVTASGNISGSSTSTGSFGYMTVQSNADPEIRLLRRDSLIQYGEAIGKVVFHGTDSGGGQALAEIEAQMRGGNMTPNDAPTALIFRCGRNDSAGVEEVMRLNFFGASPAAHISGALTVHGDVSGSVTSTGSFHAGHIVNKLGIGTTSPKMALDVSGSLRSYSLTIQSEAATSMSINFTQANNFFIDLQHDSAFSASHDSVCVGQSGVIAVRQDGTGGHVLTLPSTWKTPRGASITWNDDPDDMNLISYYIVSSSFVAINYMGDFS